MQNASVPLNLTRSGPLTITACPVLLNGTNDINMKEIITKFAVANHDNIDAIIRLSEGAYHEKELLQEMNGLSNIWLIVYVDKVEAGYACITTKGERPEALMGKKTAFIKDFLVTGADKGAQTSLMEKCLQAGNRYDVLWTVRKAEDPDIPLFHAHGFADIQAGQDFSVALKVMALYPNRGNGSTLLR